MNKLTEIPKTIKSRGVELVFVLKNGETKSIVFKEKKNAYICYKSKKPDGFLAKIKDIVFNAGDGIAYPTEIIDYTNNSRDADNWILWRKKIGYYEFIDSNEMIAVNQVSKIYKKFFEYENEVGPFNPYYGL